MAQTVLKKVLPAGALLGTLIISLGLYVCGVRSPAFLSTSSPGGIYTVNLTGQKDRPLFFTNEVGFNVSKHGKPLVPNTRLHSADAFDLSFEAGYPNHRWLGENILQFYREEYFNGDQPDTLVITNKTERVIKWLRVQSVDKFLLFDLPPKSVTRLPNSRPRGDFKDVYVEGNFYDRPSFKNRGVGVPVPEGQKSPLTYHINITTDGPAIEGPQLEAYVATE